MTFTQISYFLEVGRCLNFTEAAKHLYITQPTLSRQITAIESELNMQLFIRNQKSLKLTPSGIVLMEELTRLLENYQQILEKAERVSQGLSGSLKIGVLDGHDISEILPEAIEYFERQYPNIKIYMQRFSYRKLTEALYLKELDAIITYDFDVADKVDVRALPVQQVRPVLVLPKRNPLAEKSQIFLKDIKDEVFVIVNEKECGMGVHLIIETCRKFGGFYPNFYFVDSMEDAILWVEAGIRCAIFNTGMNIMNSKTVKVVSLPELPSMNAMLAWYKENDNDSLSLLINYFQKRQETITF